MRVLGAGVKVQRAHLVTPERAATAMAQAELRVAAADKLGADAARMYFTRDGLEQSTRREVARHRAARLALAHPGSVVDLGCGTGVAGACLREHGLATVDGIDISPEMLQIAVSTNVYRQLVVADLTAPVPGPSGAYGGSISAGTFTSGHVGPDAIFTFWRRMA